MMKFILILLSLLLVTPAAYAGDTPATTSGDRTVIEGILTQVSKLPTAETNPYPDCYFTATMEIHHIVSGKSVPQKVALVLPGFFLRKYAPEAKLRAGEKVRAVVVPFSSMPEKVRQTQQADDVEDVDLEFYYPKEIAPIAQFQTVPNPVAFAVKGKKVETTTELQPIDTEAKHARREAIQHDLDQINRLLAGHGGDWERWHASLKEFRDQYTKQYEAKAQRWVGNSFFSAGYVDSGKMFNKAFIDSIIEFKQYLAARNVDLILVRVPNKGEIVDDLFASVPADQVTNPYLLLMYKELLEADVEIITDVIPRAKEQRGKFPLMYWYQNFAENHPAEGMAWVIAEELASRVSRYNKIRNTPKEAFGKRTFIKGPITESWQKLTWPAGNPKFSDADFVRYQTIVDHAGKPLDLKKGQDSPVLMLGSSFIAAPSLPNGGSIPHYFAYLTGIAPDLVYRRDADYMMRRIIAREGDDFLKGRVVCLFPFVPWLSHKGLATLPFFNPESSAKALVASLSGQAMKDTIEVVSVPKDATAAYRADGTLVIGKIGKDSEPVVTLRVKVPEAVFSFPGFIMSLQFAGNDVCTVTVRYAQRSDTVKRGPTVGNEELFALITSKDKEITIDIAADKFRSTPAEIKGITFYGVKKPAHYRADGQATP